MTNIAWLLESAAREAPDNLAVVGPNENEYTYEEFNSLTSQIGNLLREEYDIDDGDVISGFMPASEWTQAVMFGVPKAGGIITLENHTLPYEILRGNLENAETKVVIADKQVFDEAEQLVKDVDSLEHVVWSGEGGAPLLQEAVTDYSTELYPTPKKRDDVAIINYTAGTTGSPKGAMQTHGMLQSSVRADCDAYRGLTSEDSLVLFAPIYHIGGITSALYAVGCKGTHILPGGWDPQRVRELNQKYDPTWYTYFPPTMIRDLMNQDWWDDVNLSGIKTLAGGGPLTPDLQQALQEKGMRVTGGLAMTEATPISASPIAQDKDLQMPPGSVGKPLDELIEAKLVDISSGEEITDPNKEGELCIRGDHVTPGYYNDPDRTDQAFDNEGWFHTDDMGYFDEDGYLFITGRADDMILTGAEKLSLVEVDDALLKSELIDDGGTVGVPHERFGTAPAALVVPHNSNITEEEIADKLDKHMKDNLADWQRPRLYTIVDEIPRTPAKQTKISPKLEEKLPEWVEVPQDVSFTTLSKLREERDE